MAETQEASIGWGGEAWLDDALGVAKELVQVVSFTLPTDTAERVETTHLKSPQKRKQYTGGMLDTNTIEITLNFRPGSDTDVLIEGALAAATTREVKLVVPHLGVAAYDYTFPGIVTGYDKGQVVAGDKMEAKVMVEIAGAVTKAVHA